MSEPHSDVQSQLHALQQAFQTELPARLERIRVLWDQWSTSAADTDTLNELTRRVHSLAGAAGTFGAPLVSHAARQMELGLAPYAQGAGVDTENLKLLASQFQQLATVARHFEPSPVPFFAPDRSGPRTPVAGHTVYVVDDEPATVQPAVQALREAGYAVTVFSDLDAFGAAIGHGLPDAIVMDMIFTQAITAGADTLARLRERHHDLPPVIFVSVRDHMDVRLAAARAGAARYFTKPIDVEKLRRTLDGLTARVVTEPYRVLLVEDDHRQAEYYATVLTGEGMQVTILQDPLRVLEALPTLQPDLLLTDIYMPGCTGLELASVIRQDDAYAQMPIVFLSTEHTLDRQLAAMNLGGDDFLTKPVAPTHLVRALTARMRRARWVRRLHRELQTALRESEFRRHALDQHSIVSITDPHGAITSVNDKFCEISGYSRDELLGQNHRIINSGLHPPGFFETMWATIIRGRVWSGIIRNRGKDGSYYWVDSTIVPFLDENGAPYQYVSVRTDITDLVETQHALREREERLRRSQAFANIGTWDWNIQTGELYWSERINPLFGYPEGKLTTTYDNFLNAVHPDDRQGVIDAVNACVATDTPYDVEHRCIWPDGSVHWLLERGAVVRDAAGAPQHMLGVVQDITTRKNIQLTLQASEQRLKDAQNIAHMGHWTLDIGSGELTWSEEIYRIFGHQPGDFVPSYERFFAAVHPDDADLVKRSERQAFDQGLTHSIDHRIVQPDGTVRWVHEEASARRNDAGLAVQLSGTVQDITERKRIEDELRAAKVEAERANHAKSQFLSSMSHELRTPMNAILGFSQLLLLDGEHALDAEQRDNVGEILRAGQHLLELINEVLDLAKVEAGQIKLAIERVELDSVLHECANLLLPLAQRKGITLSIPPHTAAVALADRMRLKQVLINIMSNGVKYNRNGGELHVEVGPAADGKVRIQVRDTGLGIPRERLHELFTAFSRLGAERTSEEGTGIGLVISKNIMERMNGDIGVTSTEGAGSTFWIDIPTGTAVTGLLGATPNATPSHQTD